MTVPGVAPRPPAPLWQKALPWLITLVCFGFLWTRVNGAAARAGLDVGSYMAGVLASVRWGPWRIGEFRSGPLRSARTEVLTRS